MIGPLVLVHPSEEHVQHFDEGTLLDGKGLFMFIELPHHFVTEIDDVSWLFRFPESVLFLVPGFDEESDVVEETYYDLSLLALASEYTQKMTAHVLTGLVACTYLVLSLVDYTLAFKNFLQFIDTVVGVDGCILFVYLH